MGYCKMLKQSLKFSKLSFFQTVLRCSVIVFVDTAFIGSPANQTIVLSSAVFLYAGRNGLAPSANKSAFVDLKLKTRDSGLKTNDPAGFTAVDTLAFGAIGHIVGVGIYLSTVGQNLN